MASYPRPINSISTRITRRNLQERKLCADKVLEVAMATIRDTLPLRIADKARYPKESVLAVLLQAAAKASSIEDAAKSLKDAPHPNTVRLTLQGITVITIEEHLNKALLNRSMQPLLKQPLEIACDLKFIPYWGKPDLIEQDFIWKGRAFCGTTLFFVYATLYVIKNGHRFTLAVHACRKSEGLLGALKGLLQKVF